MISLALASSNQHRCVCRLDAQGAASVDQDGCWLRIATESAVKLRIMFAMQRFGSELVLTLSAKAKLPLQRLCQLRYFRMPRP
jgi:hypothetical protein